MSENNVYHANSKSNGKYLLAFMVTIYARFVENMRRLCPFFEHKGGDAVISSHIRAKSAFIRAIMRNTLLLFAENHIKEVMNKISSREKHQGEETNANQYANNGRHASQRFIN